MQEIKIKQVGQNLFVTIDNDKVLTKKFDTKEERDNVKALVTAYTQKPTKKQYDVIVKLMTVNTVKEKEKKVIEKKIAKQATKKLESKPKITKEAEEIAKLIEENKALKAQLKAQSSKIEEQAKNVKPIKQSSPEY
jgi:hypothetical protein